MIINWISYCLACRYIASSRGVIRPPSFDKGGLCDEAVTSVTSTGRGAQTHTHS
jgi:hypothetical protein